jgi:hypothetical protein
MLVLTLTLTLTLTLALTLTLLTMLCWNPVWFTNLLLMPRPLSQHLLPPPFPLLSRLISLLCPNLKIQ